MRTNRASTLVGATAAAFVAVAVPFIGGWEGLRTTAYRDIVGVWTVCYGETRGVRPGDSYTKAQCDEMLAREVVVFHQELTKCMPTLPMQPVGVQVAVVSWGYNVGTGARGACGSTLAKKLNAGDVLGACNQLPRWNRAGGQVIRGLTNRRIAERDLCIGALI